MAEMEEEIIKESEYKPYLWWSYIGDMGDTFPLGSW